MEQTIKMLMCGPSAVKGAGWTGTERLIGHAGHTEDVLAGQTEDMLAEQTEDVLAPED